MDKFKDIPIPLTEYQTNLKELSKSPIEQWLESFTREHMNDGKESIELLGSEIYELFKNWCSENGIKYEIDSRQKQFRIGKQRIRRILKNTSS